MEISQQTTTDHASGSRIEQNKRWLAIDTDAGIDDAVAICMALKLSSFYGMEVKMISCVQGNCDVKQVGINCVKCREACFGKGSQSPPIYIGAAEALDGTQNNASFFHGADGLGDVVDDDIRIDIDVTKEVEEMSAIDALNELIEDAASQEDVHLTIIALGPLTNIAKSMMKMKGGPTRFITNVDEFIFMGGCGNARGNVTRVAEFNVHNDCEAAEYVFRHWVRENVSVASWEYTVENALPWEDFERLLQINNSNHSSVGNFLSKVLYKAYGSQGEISGDDPVRGRQNGVIICDPCAMAYCLDKKSATSYNNVNVEVECKSELTRGMTVIDWGSYDGATRVKNVKWLEKMDINIYVEMLNRICLNQ
jgi:purine nucleosidase